MENLNSNHNNQPEVLTRANGSVKGSQDRYYRLLNAIHEVYYLADATGKITEISPSIATVSGYDCDEVVGYPATFFYKHPEDRVRLLALLEKDELVTDYEVELKHKDGSSIFVSANIHMIFSQAGVFSGVEGLLRDITERVKLEEQLHVLNEELEMRVAERTAELEDNSRQLKKFSQAIEQSAEGFIITDCSGSVEYVNPAFERINGYCMHEIKGKNLSILNSGKHDADFFHNIWSTIRSGRVWEGTITNRRKDGSEYPALMTIVPIEHDGEIEFYAAIQQDMTEYERLEAQFHQAQKMDAIGTLVGGIAHDFNNMLAGLLMHLYLAKKNITDTDKAVERLKKAEVLGYQASEMIKGLLIFSRDEENEMKPLVFNSMLRDSFHLLQISIPAHIKTRMNICEEEFSINGDLTQLQQVLMNMLNNARDALKSSSDGCIEVSLEHFFIDQDFADKHPDMHEESVAKLSIRDNGCGIPAAAISKIFDPFFTTKAAGHGTGLGLSMVYGCVKNHGGLLEVESEAGVGSTFHIYLPIIDEQPAVVACEASEEVCKGNGEMILVADDNKMVRQLIVDALQTLNYRTVQATDGNEAIRLFEEHQGEIKLAILDMVMPRMSGREVARRIRMSAPALPLIFATGHDEQEAIREVNSFKDSILYEKPFKMKLLSEEMYKLLQVS